MKSSFLRGRLALALVAVVAAACATSGDRFDTDLVPYIERGRSTQDDVRRWFGEPTSIRVRGSGKSVWTYSYEERLSGSTHTIGRVVTWIARLFGRWWWTPPIGVTVETVTRHRLTVMFDEEGVTTEYEYSRQRVPIRRVG